MSLIGELNHFRAIMMGIKEKYQQQQNIYYVPFEILLKEVKQTTKLFFENESYKKLKGYIK